MIPHYLSSLFSLEGRVAVVTGAARGNGAALAEALLRAGAKVLLVDVLPAELESTHQRFRSDGLESSTLLLDLTELGAAERVHQAVMDAFGACNVLVNNAGITLGGDLLDYSDDAWEQNYRVNLKAPFALARRLARTMKDTGRGSIINITSLNAELAFPGNPAYVAFKGALKQLTKSLALDLGPFGIRANAIGPGYMRTSMTAKSFADPVMHAHRRDHTALGRWGVPEDLAGAVIFLASDASSYVTGIDLYVDGGWLIKGL